MATAAEPRPAELPLPGGREGASVRLHPLLTGRMIGPPAWFLRQDGRLAWRRALGFGVPRREWLQVPVPCFLVEHPRAGPVLIDTGLHASVAVEPAKNMGRLSLIVFKDLRMEPEQAAAAQLRARGIEPAEVKVVVMTHLHVDHASAISDFPDATFVVSTTEWAAATGQGRLHGYVRRQFDHAFDYRLLDFEGPDASSFASFGRSFDLFGDGSVRCVYTPGHTPGHMSVVLRLRRREALVAGDAVYLRRNLEEMRLSHRTADDHLSQRSLREIRRYAQETPDALIVPGHDWQAWEELDPVYD
jgi:glyoxylase-like metal-dependent hydrolase (beta-lactamase superfamily II)